VKGLPAAHTAPNADTNVRRCMADPPYMDEIGGLALTTSHPSTMIEKMTAIAERSEVRSLLRLDEGYVHSDVYTSPSIFELEIEQIFHRGWVYVGHESEIPANGDYVLRRIGPQSVML